MEDLPRVTALKTGLRVGELLALKWEDLDLVAGRVVVRRTLWHEQEGTPKGGRYREVPLSEDAVSTLLEMTMRYAHLSPDVKRDAVQLLDRPLDSGALRAPTLGVSGNT